MRGDESRVVESFCDWLHERGWRTDLEVAFVDVLATGPDGERLFAEVKGSSPDIGIDADVMYGQLLRRMSEDHDATVRYAAVIRDDARSVRAVLRVPASVRAALRIDLYAVSEDGTVRSLS